MVKKALLVPSILLFILLIPFTLGASEENIKLDKANIDLTDQASLQRGAKLFMNYCSGCHSLRMVRYEGMAQDVGIVDAKGQVLEKIVKDNLIFGDQKISDPILAVMPKADATNWFGVPPPDLSLVSRSRGVDWLYSYLRSFYQDATKPWGVNNLVFPDAAMPHVLLSLQGLQVRVNDHLELKIPGSLTTQEYDMAVRDLVNFLALMGEPTQLKRERLGVWVLLFLGIFCLFAWLLKREYWKDVH